MTTHKAWSCWPLAGPWHTHTASPQVFPSGADVPELEHWAETV